MKSAPGSPLWLSAPSRFAGMSVKRARRVSVLLCALFLLSLTAFFGAGPRVAGNGAGGTAGVAHGSEQTDLLLYEGIVDAMRHGEGYYPATARNLRAGDYPLRPFVTFRLPTLAVMETLLPPKVVLGLLYALVAAVVLAWYLRLREALGLPGRLFALAMLAAGLLVYVQPTLWAMHEVWAGLLVALSLALRRPGRWVDAVAVGLAAALLRETAALYLVLMSALAWRDGARREALAWAGAVLVLAAVLVFHAVAVARVVSPLDPASPGWSGLLGFGFFLKAVAASTALSAVPMAVATPLLALALFGWTAWKDPLAVRVAAVLAGYAAVLSVFGRADTFYWALLVAPLVLMGLAFAPDGLRDLFAAMLDRRRIHVQRITR